MLCIRIIILSFVLPLAVSNTFSQNLSRQKAVLSNLNSNNRNLAAGCLPAKARNELNINNVRAQIWSDGQNWSEREGEGYIVPKVSQGETGVGCLYSGGLWIGGLDKGNNLKLSCQSYRSSGSTDFWPGTLDNNSSVDINDCNNFDKVWNVYLSKELDLFLADVADGKLDNPIPEGILNWPGRSNPLLSYTSNKNLAPFVDVGGDNIYNPGNIIATVDTITHNTVYKADYPILDAQFPDGIPDQLLYNVYNDKGNLHTQTGGDPIGLEIHQLSFAFETNNELNNSTFYRYKIINHATADLNNTYIGQFMDTDLGWYDDDYIGCDSTRGLMVLYNGKTTDESGSWPSYGNQPPMFGCDILQGPKNESGIEIPMSSFNYIFYSAGVQGAPTIKTQYYGYLSGLWADGTPFTCGGTGYNTSGRCKFLFPGDPANSSEWSECSEKNPPQDKASLQTCGPFTLKPGAVNEMTISLLWVRPPVGTYPCPSFKNTIFKADDLAQILYENHFQLVKGPEAPGVSIVELDKQLILSINDYAKTEKFKKVDKILAATLQGKGILADSFYTFQGYKIYQLKDNNVTNADLSDPSKIEGKAKLLYTIDLKDGITALTNYNFNQETGVYEARVMTKGDNNGIRHTFVFKSDEFSKGDRNLINYKSYYYIVVPYAHNQFRKFDETKPDTFAQLIEYLEGTPIKISGIPHKSSFANLQSGYGDGFEITSVAGTGNGGNILNISGSTVNEILQSPTSSVSVLKYQKGSGPIKVYVYDPTKVPMADFELKIMDSINNSILDKLAHWMIINKNTGESIYSNQTIDKDNEQLFPQWGIAVNINQTTNPAADLEKKINGNGVLASEVVYANPFQKWLTGIIHDDASSSFEESDGELYYKWIMAGASSTSPADYKDGTQWLDSLEFFEKIIDGKWAPYRLCRNDANLQSGPAWKDVSSQNSIKLDSLASVDIVFTSDKSKWSRCIVLETGFRSDLNEGNQQLFNLRKHPSLNLDGTYSIIDSGRSWFPGYAINLETGQRLNILFGEDSDTTGYNGNYWTRDLIWNPTPDIKKPNDNYSPGGKHYIYVLKTRYDGCQEAYDSLTTQSNFTVAKRKIFSQMMWVSMAYVAKGFRLNSFSNGLIPTNTTVKLRVTKPYKEYNTENDTLPHYLFSTNAASPDYSTEVLKNKLDTVNIVPSPYYAYSEYEKDQLDNRIRITNLPAKCVITIYTQNGLMIKQIKKDNDSPFEEWDLKNNAGVTISSGVYIFHIKADEIGERVIKWFGVMRPLDMDDF